MLLDELKSKALEALGFKCLNDMQEEMLRTTADHKNILLLSPTGTGKTIAYLLPTLLLKMKSTQDIGTSRITLIIVPTRELAMQIEEVWRSLHTSMRSVTCCGGHDLRQEQIELQRAPAPALIIGTPGRIKDHMHRGSIDVSSVTHLILDEYDKSLELGFAEEMQSIITALSRLDKRWLTSATQTLPTNNYLDIKGYKTIDYLQQVSKEKSEKNLLTLWQVRSPIHDKLESLYHLLCSLCDQTGIIVFCNYRESAERVSHFLAEQKINNALYHGGLEQEAREKAIIRLKGGSIRVLVSTDLASRGLDITDVGHVIHYHLPVSKEAFTHRNGRTARAGATGAAYILLGPDEFLPDYIHPKPRFFSLCKSPYRFASPKFTTIYIGRGKKEKISKGDVMGFLIHKGKIEAAQIGRIDVMSHCAYVAIRKEVVMTLLDRVKGEKIKGEKTHYLLVKD